MNLNVTQATMPLPPKRPSRAAPKPVVNQAVRSAIIPSEQQGQRLLFPVKEVELNGVAMGVLSDGTPYLHLRGLAKLCGIDSGMLSRLVGNWADECAKPRGQKIGELLEQQGFSGDALHIIQAQISGAGWHVIDHCTRIAFTEGELNHFVERIRQQEREAIEKRTELPREIMGSCLAVAEEETFTGFYDSVLKESFAGPHRRLFQTIYRMGFESGWRVREKQFAAAIRAGGEKTE